MCEKEKKSLFAEIKYEKEIFKMKKQNMNMVVMVEDEYGSYSTVNLPTEDAYAVFAYDGQELVQKRYLDLLPDEITKEAVEHRGIALKVIITRDTMTFCSHQQKKKETYRCVGNPLCAGVERAVLYAVSLIHIPRVVYLFTEEEIKNLQKEHTIMLYDAE